jgi:ribosomal protein S18 acetylase RimI-like enzyme
MSIQIAFHHERPISPAAILSLCNQQAAADARTIAQTELMLQEGLTVGVWADQQLIGFSWAVTVGRLCAYIKEVVVDKRYPQARIGQKLINHLLKGLEQVEIIHLLCARDLLTDRGTDTHKDTGTWLFQHKKASDLSSPA